MKINGDEHISLQVGIWQKLTSDSPAVWSSDNPNVYIDQDGWVIALRDSYRPSGYPGPGPWIGARAVITATDGQNSDTVDITVVNWRSDKYGLEVVESLPAVKLSKASDGTIYSILGTNVNRSTDNRQTQQLITNEFPYSAYAFGTPLLITPFGYFLWREWTSCEIYYSPDLITWEVCAEPPFRGLYHAMDWLYDEITGIGYVFAGEYTTDPSERHKVYRLTCFPDGSKTFETVIDFYSQTEYAANNSNVPTARHVHVVQVDRLTGWVWVGTGDTAHESAIYYSIDKGGTWEQFGWSSQVYRSLSIWFTQNYVYWNMDEGFMPQTVWRIKKEDIPSHSAENDKRETVAVLNNGTQWYHIWIKDIKNEDAVLMAAAPEGLGRDPRGRLFLIKELPDGKTETDELLSFPSTGEVYDEFTQLEPRIQDDLGFIYCNGRSAIISGMHHKLRLYNRSKRRVRYRWKFEHAYIAY